MTINDQIAQIIVKMIDTANGVAEIRRNMMAVELGCSPSQISHVINSRFTPVYGYTVESRRGSGGYIRITRIVHEDGANMVMHIINSIGERLDFDSARVIIKNLLSSDMITSDTARIMLSACADGCYRYCTPEQREMIRSEIFKQMLISLSCNSDIA